MQVTRLSVNSTHCNKCMCLHENIEIVYVGGADLLGEVSVNTSLTGYRLFTVCILHAVHVKDRVDWVI